MEETIVSLQQKLSLKVPNDLVRALYASHLTPVLRLILSLRFYHNAAAELYSCQPHNPHFKC